MQTTNDISEVYYDFNKICRTCMAEKQTVTFQIDTNLSDKLSTLTSVQVTIIINRIVYIIIISRNSNVTSL